MKNDKFRKPLFRLGQITATPGATELLERSSTDVLDLLLRHLKGDWGVLGQEDAKANGTAVEHGYGRILSIYPIGEQGELLWIITEIGQSTTVLLLPTEH